MKTKLHILDEGDESVGIPGMHEIIEIEIKNERMTPELYKDLIVHFKIIAAEIYEHCGNVEVLTDEEYEKGE